ncbi:hypothetical protein FPOA_12123 [Fusarium poae]|uniref:Uncharacterized protein n=1 Tax=Fusarium poae TaxID=36050 RepID=A0A1B8AA88_FUSPO|nr:hypothetical protein FPOA_12123 [Fusarium poae]
MSVSTSVVVNDSVICALDGCSERFRREATMVKYQRGLHRQGMNRDDIDHCPSGSDDDESPSPLQHSSMACLPRDVASMGQAATPNGTLHRAPSDADSETQVYGYRMPYRYEDCHEIPTAVPHEYHGPTVHEQHIDDQLGHPSGAMPHQAYYVTEQGIPGVSTMASSLPTHYHLSQQVERLALETPKSAPGISASIQSSPSTFYPTSVPGPIVEDGFYTYQTAYATAEYQAATIQYHQHAQQHTVQPQQPVVSEPQHTPDTTEQYYPPSVHPQQEQWTHYDPPIEVTTIGQQPAHGSVAYHNWTTIP